MTIIPLPAFQDNYIWLLHNETNAIVIDPGEAPPVLKYLRQHSLSLSAILITHHHGDHVGGNLALLDHFKIPIYGPAQSTIPGLTHPIKAGDLVTIDSLGLNLEVIEVPGHTLDHIAYYGTGTLFCGDTLFACGCGRLFEGSPAQLFTSLQKLSRLPEQTLIYCTHEYTLANQRFALTVEPDNQALIHRHQQDLQRRQLGQPTLPTQLGLEKATNPFLRCELESVKQAVCDYTGQALDNPLEVFTALRAWKDRF